MIFEESAQSPPWLTQICNSLVTSSLFCHWFYPLSRAFSEYSHHQTAALNIASELAKWGVFPGGKAFCWYPLFPCYNGIVFGKLEFQLGIWDAHHRAGEISVFVWAQSRTPVFSVLHHVFGSCSATPVSCNFHPVLLSNSSQCPEKHSTSSRSQCWDVPAAQPLATFLPLPCLLPSVFQEGAISPSSLLEAAHLILGVKRTGGFPCEWQRERPAKVTLGAALLVSAAHFCGKSSLEMSICAGKGDAPNLGIAIRVCQGSLHVCAGRQTNTS